MGVEIMSCCGALTRVYSDENNRRHNPGCRYLKEGRWVAGVWVTKEDEERLTTDLAKITEAERRATSTATAPPPRWAAKARETLAGRRTRGS